MPLNTPLGCTKSYRSACIIWRAVRENQLVFENAALARSLGLNKESVLQQDHRGECAGLSRLDFTFGLPTQCNAGEMGLFPIACILSLRPFLAP